MPKINGLTLRWGQEIFGGQGRRYEFSFSSTNPLGKNYELVFLPEINGNEITFLLSKTIDKGECVQFSESGFFPPLPDPYCRSKGLIEIPEEWLTEKRYRIKVITPFFTQDAELILEENITSLRIPQNPYLSSPTSVTYPLPANLLMGEIDFQGSEHIEAANAFKGDLKKMGLEEAVLPYPVEGSSMHDEEGRPLDRSWEPDTHSFGLLYFLSVDMQQVVQLATEYFESSALNIHLYSTNGDQANFNQQLGINVSYVKQSP